MSIEGEQFDPKNATSVAEWYRSVMIERGYEVDFTIDNQSLIDRYCEDVLWKMDYSTELFSKEKTAFIAYVGEVIVRNSGASWFGEFDLYAGLDNYYNTSVGFADMERITPENAAQKIRNKSKDESIEENIRLVVKKMNEIEPI